MVKKETPLHCNSTATALQPAWHLERRNKKDFSRGYAELLLVWTNVLIEEPWHAVLGVTYVDGGRAVGGFATWLAHVPSAKCQGSVTLLLV